MERRYFLFKVYWDTQSNKVAESEIIIEAYVLGEAEKILLSKLRVAEYFLYVKHTLNTQNEEGVV